MQPTRKLPRRKHIKGQGDHADAWLMSYADMITLLFMLFVIFVSVTVSHKNTTVSDIAGVSPHPDNKLHSGTIALDTAFEETYRMLSGVVLSKGADQYIAVEKNAHGVVLDLSAVEFFEPGSATIPEQQLALINDIAHALKNHMPAKCHIEVEGHTNDEPLKNSIYANNWELAAVRAARVVNMLIAEGIDASALRATSFAGAKPIVPNEDMAGHLIRENRDRNQRIVIRIEAPPGAVL